MRKQKLLVTINVLLIGLLLVIFIKENYFQRLISKINKTFVTKDDAYKHNWKFKQEIDLYKVYQKQGKVVMLGNSITYRCNWNELLNRNDIINRGIGGDVTKGFLNRLESIYETNPEICLIMGGVNDLSKGIKPEMIVKNINSLIDSLKTKEIKPIVQSILFVAKDYPNAEQMNSQITATNKMLEHMCINNQEEYWDLNKILDNRKFLRKEYSFDGIHLTSEAYKKWGNMIKKFLKNRESNNLK